MNGMKEWTDKYTSEESEKVLSEVYDEIFKRRVVELESTYTQLKEKEEVTTENTETNG